MGVPGERISEADDLAGAIESAFATNAPYLIEVVISGKQ
jgi:thiamine pyrophosphate-dependent acetolactate synthase large subunit-like protein